MHLIPYWGFAMLLSWGIAPYTPWPTLFFSLILTITFFFSHTEFQQLPKHQLLTLAILAGLTHILGNALFGLFFTPWALGASMGLFWLLGFWITLPRRQQALGATAVYLGCFGLGLLLRDTLEWKIIQSTLVVLIGIPLRWVEQKIPQELLPQMSFLMVQGLGGVGIGSYLYWQRRSTSMHRGASEK